MPSNVPARRGDGWLPMPKGRRAQGRRLDDIRDEIEEIDLMGAGVVAIGKRTMARAKNLDEHRQDLEGDEFQDQLFIAIEKRTIRKALRVQDRLFEGDCSGPRARVVNG